MVATTTRLDLNNLSEWRKDLARKAENLRIEIRERQAELSQVEERLGLVTKLIEVEARASKATTERVNDSGPGCDEPTSQEVGHTIDLESAVEEILRSAAEPLHISTIRERLISQGVPIPGLGDDANIIVRLRRFQERFTRTARGTYGLAEWDIPALASKTRKRRRKVKR